ncbi:hypothetical protein Prede_0121 [Prevotella dentalis DSM 3688]|uniref:Uncharacterized protein n=1 Tax=Prevotella dentalis (strain ATCC 49559 / DSM 3688 / JCM 13448 / NCTC 12043 / ES 2772) TaxID=908937 RepID=F9D3T3_PREDD|nr:hypothetical protein [Prevotella dentalis]AGB27519.1 hypothetical protein Prede_0121 [Prevotella dentalis DSM 3688]EGQ14368.1 hypothetical protein HMPREF9136_1511 [Prevotella dentalis DSM 3688]
MSNKKKNGAHIPVREVNAAEKKVVREKRDEKQKNQGDSVVKWIFGILVALAIIYMIWSMYLVG